jgi:hypothetical protein
MGALEIFQDMDLEQTSWCLLACGPMTHSLRASASTNEVLVQVMHWLMVKSTPGNTDVCNLTHFQMKKQPQDASSNMASVH